MSTRLVIASFRENLNWLRNIVLPCPVSVLNSGTGSKWWEKHSATCGSNFLTFGDIPFTPCDNVSKEAGQYLQYIIAQYDHLADRTIFIQADMGVSVFLGSKPKHMMAAKLAESLVSIAKQEDPVGAIGIGLEPLPCKIVPFPPETHPIFGKILTPDKRPTYTVAGHVGAQFWVDKHLVRKFPKSYYQSLLKFEGSLAHDLEYVWPSVFQPDVSAPSEPQPPQPLPSSKHDSEISSSTRPL